MELSCQIPAPILIPQTTDPEKLILYKAFLIPASDMQTIVAPLLLILLFVQQQQI